jgi:hypothetical protein
MKQKGEKQERRRRKTENWETFRDESSVKHDEVLSLYLLLPNFWPISIEQMQEFQELS